MKQIYIFLVLVIGCVGMASCTDDAVLAPSGEIVGFAGLRDEAGNRLSDQSGVRVELRGTSHSATSDTSGRWTLRDVPAGIYDIVLSKPGFATNYARAYQFVGGGTAYITAVVDLIRSRLDTMLLARFSFEPEYELHYRDTLIEVDTGFMRPIDSIALPDRILRLEGDVRFESDTQSVALLYLQPYFTDLSVIPWNNYQVGVVRKGHNILDMSLQQLIQRGYPRGVPVTATFTTRQNNTYYLEPSTRQRLVTDPHDLLRLEMTLPVE